QRYLTGHAERRVLLHSERCCSEGKGSRATPSVTEAWCGRGDSNPYGITTASPSSWCVCQFRHFRVRVFEVPQLPTVACNAGNLEVKQNPQYIAACLTGTTDAAYSGFVFNSPSCSLMN